MQPQRKRRRSAAAIGATLLLVGAAAVASSCNLIVVASSDACETDEDCINLANTACDTAEGVCVSLDKCQANADCSSADQICRPFSPRTCVPLLQGNCTQVYPEDPAIWRSDKAMLIGITAPIAQGLPDESTGVSVVNGAKLAVDQFNGNNGVEGERPLALVICDDQGERAPAEENGRTLATVGVQAIIGPAFSGQTLDTATGQNDPTRGGTVSNNVLLISTSATSPLVTGIDDKSPACLQACGNDNACKDTCPGLVWRTSPSDEIQGKALSAYFATIESRVATRGGVTPARNPLKVFVLYKDDPYGELLAEVIRTTLKFNGMDATLQQVSGNFAIRVYEDVDASTDGVQPDPVAIQAALDANPDAIFLIGTGEVGNILADIESQWASEGLAEEDRPFYFLADGGLANSTSEAAGAARNRIRGSIPGTSSPNFNAFTGLYQQAFPTGEFIGGPAVFGAAGAYDAVFLLAYSSVAAGDAPLTAAQLAAGFGKLINGTRTDVGSTSIGGANSTLQQGGTIDFVGASGELQFDLTTGEAPSEIQIWCIPGGNMLGTASGIYYDGNVILGPPDPGDSMTFSCPF